MTRIKLIALSTAALIALSGCSTAPATAPASPSATVTSPAPSATTQEDHSESDVTFLQMMIPHHEQAVVMSDLVLEKPGIRADVRALAEKIKGAQQPEIDQMKSWLARWGEAPTMSTHTGHDMGGMLGDDELRKLEQADAATGQKLYLDGMIDHHKGAVTMAQNARTGSKSEDVKKLCDAIVSSQSAEIDQMEQILTQL